MTTLNAMAELARLYDALKTAYDRKPSLSRNEEIAELRGAIMIAKGNIESCRRADQALAEILTKGRSR